MIKIEKKSILYSNIFKDWTIIDYCEECKKDTTFFLQGNSLETIIYAAANNYERWNSRCSICENKVKGITLLRPLDRLVRKHKFKDQLNELIETYYD